MSRNLLRAILCGGFLVGLAAASLVLESLVNVPLANEYSSMCLTAPDRLIWWDQLRATGRKADQLVYDLDADKLEMRSFRQCPWVTSSLGNGRYVRLEPNGTSATLCIVDFDTHKTIRETTLPVLFRQELLNQRYLVTDRSGTMIVCDVLADDPSQLRTLPLAGWHPQALTQLYLVGDTNFVVSVSASLNPPQTALPSQPSRAVQNSDVHVYQIDDESIRLVAAWRSGLFGTGISRQGDTLLSLSLDGTILEGRALGSFELVRTDSLPKRVVDCLPDIHLAGDFCEVRDPRSQQRAIYRLDTLKELDHSHVLAVLDRGVLALDRYNTPYRVLYGQDSSHNCRIAVYNMDRDKLVWDRNYEGCTDAELLDGGRLAVVHSQCGITADIIDLEMQRVVRTVRPYGWLLPGYVVWAIAAPCAAFGWIYYSARAGISLLASLLILSLVVVPIQVYPLTQHGTAVNVGRLATSYALAVLLSTASGVIWIAFCQIQNRTMRFTYQLVALSVLAVVLALLTAHGAFPKKWMFPTSLFIASASAFASLLGLTVLWLLGYRTQWPRRDQSKPTLWQLFALTAASAGLVAAYMPFRAIPWQLPKSIDLVVAFATPVVAPYLLMYMLLKLSDRWFQLWTVVAAAVASILVIDFLGAFLRPHLFTNNIALANVRICFAEFVITFLWLWAFRLRGCRIARRAESKAG